MESERNARRQQEAGLGEVASETAISTSPHLVKLGKRVIKVSDEVLNVFNPDRNPHDRVACPSSLALLSRKLAVGGACGVQDQRPGVPQVGHVREDPGALHQLQRPPEASVWASAMIRQEAT